MSASDKAAALARGRDKRAPSRPPAGPPSATPLPPVEDEQHQPPGRAPAGTGRRGHLRKVSLELAPSEHDRLKLWVLTAFGGGTTTAPVLRALLAEAYTDPALTDRVRRRLEQSRD